MEFLILDSTPLPSQQRNICYNLPWYQDNNKCRPSRSSSHYPDTRQSTQITNKLKIRPGPPLAGLQPLVCDVGPRQVSKLSPGGRGGRVPQFTIGSLAELFDWNPGVVTTSTSQPAVPGTAEYGRWAGVTFVRIHTHSGSLITCTLFTRAAPLLWADYPGGVTRHSSAASIPTSSSASLSSPLPSPSPLSARADYGRNNWHISRGVMSVLP